MLLQVKLQKPVKTTYLEAKKQKTRKKVHDVE